MDCVSKFAHQDTILEKFPKCICLEHSSIPVTIKTMKDICPMQGWSVDIAFIGQIFKYLKWHIDYLSIHCKTLLILIKYYCSRYLIGTFLKTKLSFLTSFMTIWVLTIQEMVLAAIIMII